MTIWWKRRFSGSRANRDIPFGGNHGSSRPILVRSGSQQSATGKCLGNRPGRPPPSTQRRATDNRRLPANAGFFLSVSLDLHLPPAPPARRQGDDVIRFRR